MEETNDNHEFWVFLRPDGHVIASARTDFYETAQQAEADTWDNPLKRPEGEWSTQTRTQWDADSRQCLRGRCDHLDPTRRRNGREEPTPQPQAPMPRIHAAMPEQDWKAAMERVTLAMTSITAVVAQVWEPMKDMWASVVRTMHTVRIDAPHDQVCASGTGTATCFCACAACYDVSDDRPTYRCHCDFCDCKEDA